MSRLKLTQIGDALGVILPKEVSTRLGLNSGDTLYLTETPDGFRLTANNTEVLDQLEQAETIMREDRDVLRKLAK